MVAVIYERSLMGTPITDAGLVHLKDLHRLKSLDVNETLVTKGGVEILPNAIPGISIGYRR